MSSWPVVATGMYATSMVLTLDCLRGLSIYKKAAHTGEASPTAPACYYLYRLALVRGLVVAWSMRSSISWAMACGSCLNSM